ncbi:MAG: C4-dicarboxylate-specific signal transduction histidine kinase [Granulosicoccus sp.]
MKSQNQSEVTAKIYEQSLTASINQYEYLPALLSSDTLLINALLYPTDNRLLVNKKLFFIAERAGADTVYIMNTSGNVVATSNHNQTSSFLNKNYAFRPYFKRALKTGKRQFYYAQGATTGIPGFFIAEPIIYNGQNIGVAVVKLSMSYWEDNWRNAENTVITADENNIIILSSNSQWRYQTIGDLADKILKEVSGLQQFGNKRHVNLYEKEYKINTYPFTKITFWDIDNELYLSKKSSIPDVDWSFYYLVKHQQLVYPTLTFFSISSLFMLFTYLFKRERRYKIASINKNLRLEKIRQEELKTVMDNIHVGVILFTEKGDVISLNDHAKLLLFDDKTHASSTLKINDIIHINLVLLKDLLFNDISSATYHETYVINHAVNGTSKKIPVMFATSKVSAMNTELYLMTFINITRRKDAENKLLNINNSLEETIEKRTQELNQAQATLIQKNKAAALGNMAATIVHELSQPLSAINSSVSAVSAKITNGDWSGARESASRLNPLSKKMHNVINLLKNFSYKDDDDQEKILFSNAVKQSINSVKDIISDKKISLNEKHLHQPSSCQPIYVQANPLKLDLVFTNIIKNAIDAAENNSDAIISIDIEHNKEKIYLHITDNGGGIDPAIMSKLFSPYFTTKEVGKGLGLGLSISYEIIQEYNGKIYAKNIKDSTCFTIELPIFKKTHTCDQQR